MDTKHRRSFLTTASLLVVIACSGCCSNKATPGEVMVPFGTLPVAVQKTLVKALPNQTPDAVERETKNGVEVYEAKAVKADGSRQIVKVDPDGKLLSVMKKSAEVEVAWKQVPKSVRKTIIQNNGDKKADKVEKEKENGVTIYEAVTMTSSGGKHIVKVGKDGKLIMVKDK